MREKNIMAKITGHCSRDVTWTQPELSFLTQQPELLASLHLSMSNPLANCLSYLMHGPYVAPSNTRALYI